MRDLDGQHEAAELDLLVAPIGLADLAGRESQWNEGLYEGRAGLVGLPALNKALHAVVTTRADPALVKALARAFRYQRMLDQRRYASVTEMAAAEEIDRGYLGRLLQLTLLAPDTIAAILDGTQDGELTLPSLMVGLELRWEC